jgi:diguanylate cyclase (GGDEF)-like protein/putative nucleotidyltransferase with HDIG domain
VTHGAFMHLGILPFSVLAAHALAAGFFTYLQQIKPQRYLKVWTIGWYLIVLHNIIIGPIYGSDIAAPGQAAWTVFAGRFLIAASGVMFFCAARLYINSRAWAPAAFLMGSWLGLYGLSLRFEYLWFIQQIGMSGVYLAAAYVFWQAARRQESHGDWTLAAAFAGWALIPLLRPAFGPIGRLPAGPDFMVIASFPSLLAAVVMVMVLYEDQRRRVQLNILALSSLNLSTSSFMGSEIQKSLVEALERVLSVVALPSGLLSLRRHGTHEPTVTASVGIDAALYRAIGEDGLDSEFVQLVSRLGGLVVFRELEHDNSWRALEHEAAFLRFRQLAMTHGMRTVIAISLQAKEEPFGLLLLSSTENRRFTQAELRLLLTLGHQIGMAVENSYLIQQTTRRSEELHLLNEIGRALSSTLDVDELFNKIFAALKRMFDVSNFYVAMYDAEENQIRFELEIAEGIRLPKRSRPFGDHLTEYILRSRQPLLIRQNLAEEATKLGLRPVQETGSFCGVPLVAYDKAIGVMALRGLQENLYDEGHLEMMRVLASEASIAIENARLFREEQTKSRHLALLNNISRHAITTLNPQEMLSRVAEQLERGLAFDHVGIGLLDYSTKEVIIQAEAGRRRGALGRRLPLGESIIGKVARSGQVCVARNLAGEEMPGTVIEGSASVLALPVFYADQLHGVLYVETAEPTDFSEEDVRLLHTLADLISVALHNALTLQKAQEQAITDGLTGVKTHRYLMEALSAEWKRATRTSRHFSLVLIDLDRFKFVNDFYGHLEGDLVLHRVGQVLEQNCRSSDVVARYGGDEFVILMPETNASQAVQIAEKLRPAICEDPLLREKTITASFGIASFPLHGSTPQELIQVADASMYISKHEGGNIVSTADHCDAAESKKWKRDVLEAYLGVTLKRLFATGPEAFTEIRERLHQFAASLGPAESEQKSVGGRSEGEPLFGDLPPALIDTVTSLALAIDSKDHYTQGHSQKVAAYAALIAEAMGLAGEEIGEIRLGALLHDIGKVGIPEEILGKRGPLNPEEWEKMKEHVLYGDRMLEPLQTISRIREMVCHHHEMFDGSGYPHGLVGDQIPIGSRIIAIADAYDTITSDRIYKKARTPAAAFEELERCAGSQFDPELVRLFIEAVQNLPQRGLERSDIPAERSAT